MFSRMQESKCRRYFSDYSLDNFVVHPVIIFGDFWPKLSGYSTGNDFGSVGV